MKQQLLFVVAFAFAGAAFGSLPVSRAALTHGGRLLPVGFAADPYADTFELFFAGE